MARGAHHGQLQCMCNAAAKGPGGLLSGAAMENDFDLLQYSSYQLLKNVEYPRNKITALRRRAIRLLFSTLSFVNVRS
eukprot:6187685-Pleurochrysis_carterae.AAC.1